MSDIMQQALNNVNNAINKINARLSKSYGTNPAVASYLSKYGQNNYNRLTGRNTDANDWYSKVNFDKYSEDVEDKLKAEHRYTDAADYLSHFTQANMIDQIKYENEIRDLRRYGLQYDAMMSKADDSQVDGINFLESFNSGDIDNLSDNNPFKNKYIELIRSLNSPAGVENRDKTVGYTQVTFNKKHVKYGLWGLGFDWMSEDEDKNQFDDFLNYSGYTENNIKDLIGEGSISKKDGKYVLTIDNTNLKGIKLLTDISKWELDNNKNNGVVFAEDADVAYGSLDTDGNYIQTNVDPGFVIRNVKSLLDEANVKQEEVLSNIEAPSFDIQTVPYMNEYQAQISSAMTSGLISLDEGKKRIEEDNKNYVTLIVGEGLSKYDVYTDDPKFDPSEETNDNFHKIEHNSDKSKIRREIANASRENRLVLNSGISGGQYGTFITILDKDEKGELTYDDEGNANQGKRYFIPGLFSDSVQTAFNASTQGKTVQEYNSLQQYGYEYPLKNGQTMVGLGNDVVRVFNEDKSYYTDYGREEAYKLLHESILEEDAVSTLKVKLFNLDGSVRKGYDYKSDVQNLAVIGANEIYNDYGNPVTVDEVFNDKVDKANSDIYTDNKREKAYEMYNYIMSDIFKLLNKEK